MHSATAAAPEVPLDRVQGLLHDLRAPLHVALGELFLASQHADRAAADNIRAAEAALGQLAAVLESREAQASQIIAWTDLVKDVAHSLRIHVDVGQLGDSPGSIATARSLLQNLLHNAQVHGRPPIRVVRDGDAIEVRDNGVGLSAPVAAALRNGAPIPTQGRHGLGLQACVDAANMAGWRLTSEGGFPRLIVGEPS